MGISVNPEFIKAADNLIEANKTFASAKAQVDKAGNKQEDTPEVKKMQEAAAERQKAESVYTSLKGIIEDSKSNLSQEEAVRQLDSIIRKVSIFYQ